MKKIRIITGLSLIMMLAGCMSKKAVINESREIMQTDTTKSVTDSLVTSLTAVNTESNNLLTSKTTTDTTKTAAEVERSAVIDFMDGGSISIDTVGNVTLSGVKSIRSDFMRRKSESKGFAQADEMMLTEAKETAEEAKKTNTHGEQANGITSNEQNKNLQEQETKVTRPKWYQTVFAKIGGLCCIVALLWAIFLYLKRKF